MRVVITGGSGTIGRIIHEGLRLEHELTLVDRRVPTDLDVIELDIATDDSKLRAVCKDADCIIHLAWDFAEDFPNEHIEPFNKRMAENIYRIAAELGIPKVIMASSVHADDYSMTQNLPITVKREPVPDTPYGASKLYIEALGRYYAQRYGMDVIAIRFGGVNSDDEIRYQEDPLYDQVLLLRSDCVDLIRTCLAREPRGSYSCLYAVSNNPTRVHSTENEFGWQPTSQLS